MDELPLKPLNDIPRMSDMAPDMLRRSLDALVHKDTVAAMGVCHDDDDVDALYDQVYRELIFFYDTGPQDHPARHLPAVGGARPGTRRRPGNQHCGAGNLHGDGEDG